MNTQEKSTATSENENVTKILLRIDKTLKKQLEDIAKKECRNLTGQITYILQSYVESQGGK